MRNRTSIAIIGTGQVGTATAFQLVISGLADDVILVDRKAQVARSQALDLDQAASALSYGTRVRSGDYAACADADIVVLTASKPLPEGAHRDALLPSSCAIVDSIVPAVVESGFDGIFVIITNPVDVISQRVQDLSGFPRERIIGTGTAMDSLRLRRELARIFAVDEQSIQAYAMGEHGDTQMVPWSSVMFWGKPLSQVIEDNPDRGLGVDPEEVRARAEASAWEIVKGKGTTSFGIAATTCAIISAIVRDEHSIIPVSVRLDGEYGHEGVFAGVPAVLAAGGLQEIVNLHLTGAERADFDRSVAEIERQRSLAPALPAR